MARKRNKGWILKPVGILLIIISLVIFAFDLYASFEIGKPEFLTIGKLLFKTGFQKIILEKGIFKFWIWLISLILGALIYILSPKGKKHIFK